MRGLGLALILAVWVQAAALADMPAVAVLPVSNWRVEAGKADRVALSEQGGCLVIDYDVDVADWHQVGHQSLKQKTVRLLLASPVALPADARRVVFEAWGHQVGNWQTQDRCVQFRPLLQDAGGEWLSYTAVRSPHLKNGAETWARWMSSDFYAGEAGGATQDVFEAEGGDANAWPDGRLRLAGFEITVRRPEFGRRAGRLALGEVRITGARFPYEPPFAYADSLLPKTGEYRVASTVAAAFQGPPCRESAETVVFDKDDLASGRRRIVFPLGPDGPYWISYQVTDAAGAPVAADAMRTRAIGNPDTAPLGAVDPAAPPAMGHLRIDWGRGAAGLFSPGEPLALKARVFPKGRTGPLSLHWELRQFRFPAVIEQGTAAVPDTPTYEDVPIALQGEPGRDAYRLVLTLRQGKTVLDSRTLDLGRLSGPVKARTARAGMVLDRDYVKKGAYFRVTYLVPSTAKFASEDEALADFVKQVDEIARLTRYVTYMIDVRDLEALPGVFDFPLLDRIMDAAADRGVALTVRVAHVDALGEYPWQPYYRQLNFDGTPIFEHYYGSYSLVDDAYTSLWHRAYRALYDRYARHPGFQGYYLLQPAGEATLSDKPWEGIVSGYEPPMADAFRRFLREHDGLTLERLNARWGARYASWDEVRQPLPNFALGRRPDLSMAWVDFSRFKGWLDKEGWFPEAARRIREYDPNHVMIVYGILKSQRVAGLVDYMHNGGNHFLQMEGKLVDAWEQGRTGWITEPHHPHRWAAYGDPAEAGWVLDWSVWVMTAQAGAGGANLHVYYDPRPGRMAAHYGGEFALDRMQKFRPILDELHTMRLVERPLRTAVLQDPYTLWCKHRTVFWPRTEDLKRWFELAKLDSVRYEDFDPAHAAEYRLVLPNIIDTVVSEETLDRLDAVVRGGARMLLCANTGTYCPEKGEQTFQLLRRLGIEPPATEYRTDVERVTATVEQDGPLFDKGAPLRFFSVADLRRDLQSKEVRETFWAYPYRWIPLTDYFGYYPGHACRDGRVLARFADGGAALSLHSVGKGEVLVFWGTPDYQPVHLKGMMARAAAWAGIEDPLQGAPVPRMLEGYSSELGRRYVLLYHEKQETCRQPFPAVPDGDWLLDDMVNDQKLGTWAGAELRAGALPLTWAPGMSPLKIIRCVPADQVRAPWAKKYRQIPK